MFDYSSDVTFFDPSLVDDSNGASDILLWDRSTGEIVTISRNASVPLITSEGASENASISSDGTRIVYQAGFGDVLPVTPTPFFSGPQVILWDIVSESVLLASSDDDANPGNQASSSAQISANGLFTVFVTEASNLVDDPDLLFTTQALLATNSALPGASSDTDGDGLSDEQEAVLGTDPTKADTDADGVSDGDEFNVHGTNPLARDSDGDGRTDGREISDNSNPLDDQLFTPFPFSIGDVDADGVPDFVDFDNSSPGGAEVVPFPVVLNDDFDPTSPLAFLSLRAATTTDRLNLMIEFESGSEIHNGVTVFEVYTDGDPATGIDSELEGRPGGVDAQIGVTHSQVEQQDSGAVTIFEPFSVEPDAIDAVLTESTLFLSMPLSAIGDTDGVMRLQGGHRFQQ